MRVTRVYVDEVVKNKDNPSNYTAKVTITLDEEIAVHDITVSKCKDKFYLNFPTNTKFRRDVAHPINEDCRKDILLAIEDVLEPKDEYEY